MSEPTIDEQIRCVRREIRMRENVYPRWIGQERMTQETADRELNTMRAVLATLERAAKASPGPLFGSTDAPGREPAGWRLVPVDTLARIATLIDPPPLDINGKTHVFQNPNAGEVLTRISAEFRSLVNAAPPDEPTAGREPAAETALRRVLDVVQRYLPPDGPWRLPEAHEAMSEIIAIVDPWPLAAPAEEAQPAEPVFYVNPVDLRGAKIDAAKEGSTAVAICLQPDAHFSLPLFSAAPPAAQVRAQALEWRKPGPVTPDHPLECLVVLESLRQADGDWWVAGDHFYPEQKPVAWCVDTPENRAALKEQP